MFVAMFVMESITILNCRNCSIAPSLDVGLGYQTRPVLLFSCRFVCVPLGGRSVRFFWLQQISVERSRSPDLPKLHLLYKLGPLKVFLETRCLVMLLGLLNVFLES